MESTDLISDEEAAAARCTRLLAFPGMFLIYICKYSTIKVTAGQSGEARELNYNLLFHDHS